MGQSPEHYFSTLNDSDTDVCMTIAKPSARQIRMLPAFKDTVQSDKIVRRKVIVALVQDRGRTNLQHYRNKVYRAKEYYLTYGCVLHSCVRKN